MNQPADQQPSRRLYRSRTQRIIGGVAGGMAEYFGVDASLMRLIFVLLIMLPGIGVLTYLIAWLIIPENPQSTPAPTPQGGSSRQMLGLILVVVGAVFLMAHFIDLAAIWRFWPLLLIGIGLAIIMRKDR